MKRLAKVTYSSFYYGEYFFVGLDRIVRILDSRESTAPMFDCRESELCETSYILYTVRPWQVAKLSVPLSQIRKYAACYFRNISRSYSICYFLTFH